MEYTVHIEDGPSLRGFRTWQNAMTYAINLIEKQKYAWIHTVDGDLVAVLYKYSDGYLTINGKEED